MPSSMAWVGLKATRPRRPVSCTICRKRRLAWAIWIPGVFISEWMWPVSPSTVKRGRSWE